jgi:hypothetical protein
MIKIFGSTHERNAEKLVRTNFPLDRDIAQALSRRLPTTAARVRAPVRSCGICGGQTGTGVGFLRVLRFPLPIRIPPIAPQWPSSIIRRLYNGRSTKWTQSCPMRIRKPLPFVYEEFSFPVWVEMCPSDDSLRCVSFPWIHIYWRSPDSWVGIGTGLRAGRPGFDSRQGQVFHFSTASRSVLRPNQSTIQWIPGGNAAGAWRWPLTSI